MRSLLNVSSWALLTNGPCPCSTTHRYIWARKSQVEHSFQVFIVGSLLFELFAFCRSKRSKRSKDCHPHPPRLASFLVSLLWNFHRQGWGFAHAHCLSALALAARPAEGILLQAPEALSKEALFACVLKMEMIIIKDVSRIMSGILSRSAHLTSHSVLHYRITFCSAAPQGLFGVGHGFGRDWGQSQQCLQTQEACQQDMAKSKYDLCVVLKGWSFDLQTRSAVPAWQGIPVLGTWHSVTKSDHSSSTSRAGCFAHPDARVST